jgi:hypothetical protein
MTLTNKPTRHFGKPQPTLDPFKINGGGTYNKLWSHMIWQMSSK